MSLHFCGDSLIGVSLFKKEATPKACCASELSECLIATSSSDDDCCKDSFIDLDWNTDIAIQSSSILDLEVDDATFTLSLDPWIINSPQAIVTPQSYIPPLLPEKRSVLFQQFLL